LKTLKKITIITAASAAFLVLLAFALLKTGVLTGSIKSAAEREAKKATGKEITIGRVELGLYNTVTLRDVTVPVGAVKDERGVFAEIGGVILRLSLADIITGKKNPVEALSTVIIDKPRILVERSGGTVNAAYFMESLGNTGAVTAAKASFPEIPLPVSKLLIENGTITYSDKDANVSTEVSMIKGSVGLSAKNRSLKVFLSGKTRPSIKRDLSVGGEYFFDKSFFTGSAVGKNSDVSYFVSLFAPKGPYEIKSGQFSFDVKVSGKEPDISKMDIKGALSMRGAVISLKNGPEFTGVSGDISLDNNKAELLGLDFSVYGGRGRIKGLAYEVMKRPRFEINMRVDSVDLQSVNPAMNGKMSALFDISGNTENIKAGGTVSSASALISGVPVQNFAALIRFGDNKAQLTGIKGSVMGGNLDGSIIAFAGRDGKINGNITLKKADLSKVRAKEKLSGTADIDLKVYGKASTPRFEALAASPEIKAGQYVFERVNVQAFYYTGSGYASVNASSGFGGYEKLALNAEAENAKEGFVLRNLSLSEGSAKILTASGKELPDGTLDFKASLIGADIGKLKLPALSGKNISGLVNAEASFTGTRKEPKVQVSLNSRALNVREKNYSLSSVISFHDDVLKITGFNLADTLRGSVNYSLRKKIFEFFADFKDFNGDIIAEASGMEWLSGSTINGNTVFRKTNNGYGGKAEITGVYEKGLYRNFELRTTGEAGKFDIQKAMIRQEKGKLEASGNFSFKNDTDIILDARGKMENYRLSDKAVIDCAFSAAGNAVIKEKSVETYTRLKAAGLKVNGRQEGDLDTNLRAEAGNYDFRFALGDAYLASLKFTGGADGIVDADIRLKDADLNPVFAALGADRKPLPKGSELRAGIKIKGPAETALFTADILQNQGLIKAHGRVSMKQGVKPDKAIGAALKYDIANVSLKDIGMIADAAFSEQGRLSGSGDFTLQEGRVKLKGDILAKTGRIAGIDYDDITGEYIFDNKRFTFKKMTMNYKKTLLDLSGSYVESSRKGEYDMFISPVFRNFRIQGNLLNGSAKFFGRLGTGKNTVLNGTLESEDFTFKKHKFRPFKLKVESGPESVSVVSLKGESTVNFRMDTDKNGAVIKEASITRNGEVMLNASGFSGKNGDLSLSFDGTGIEPQLVDELMDWGHKWKGVLNGNVKVTGVKGKSPSLVIAVNIKNGNVDGLDFDMADMLIHITDDWLNLSPLSPILITRNGYYDINVTGKVPVPMSEEAVEKLKGVPMDVKISIKEGDLSILKILGFIQDASGPVNAQLRMTGTKEFPSLSGKIDVTDGTVKLKYLFRELKHVYANLLISDNVVDIYELKGDTERGTLKIENLNEKKGGLMKFMKLSEFNWKITSLGDSVRFTDTAYLEFLRGDADLNLALTGPLESPFMQGTMHVHDFTYLYPIRTKSADGTEAPINDEDNFAKKIIWDIAVTGGDNVRYYSNYLNNYADIIIAPWQQPLKVQDKANTMKLTGNLRIKRGTYKYMNAEFLVDDLKESKITFDGDKKPVLDAYANTKFRRFKRYESPEMPIDLTVKFRVWGRVGDLKLDLSSEPTLGLNERDRLLYIMTFGSDINPNSSEFRAEDAAKLADAVASFWIKKGTEQIIGYTPFDVFNIKVDVSKFMQGSEPQKQSTPQVDSGGNTAAASKAEKTEAAVRAEIDMGKYLTDSLYVGYNLKLLDASSILPEETLDFQHTVEF